MNLFKETINVIVWLLKLGKAFFKLRPVTSGTVIIATTISGITAILAAMLPLKVILLVGSEGVPGYFKPLTRFADKETLIWVFSVGAVVCYFATIALTSMAERLAASASLKVLSGSNSISVLSEQGREMRDLYAQHSKILANILFLIAGFTLLAYLDANLTMGILGTFGFLYLFTFLIILNADLVHPRALRRIIIKEFDNYLKFLSSITFLVAFCFLIYPFIWGGGGHILVAIVCIIVFRPLISAVSQSITLAVRLYSREAIINALVFRHHQFQNEENSTSRSIRDIFYKEARQQRTKEVLESIGIGSDSIEVYWRDPPLPSIGILAVEIKDEKGQISHYQYQIYYPKQEFRLENEEVLFSYIPREDLFAPHMQARFSENAFQCQLCEAGRGRVTAAKNWRDVQALLFKDIMAVEPPRRLIDSFSISRPLPPDRLTEDLIRRIEFSLDTDQERESYYIFIQIMPYLKNLLKSLPLYIFNPEIHPLNVLQTESDSIMVMTWGRWSLELLGAGMPMLQSEDLLEGLVDYLKANRDDINDSFDHRYLLLGGLLWNLETQINQGKYKAALSTINLLLSNTLLESEIKIYKSGDDNQDVNSAAV